MDFEKKQGKRQNVQNNQELTVAQHQLTIPAPPALQLPLTPILAHFSSQLSGLPK
jgi:hypothetical protein